MSFNRTALATAVTCLVSLSQPVFAGPSSLTLFHNNDGESKLLGSGSFGGFDYFLGELDAARTAASGAGRDVLTVSSGDNFLAGLAFQSSQTRVAGAPAGSVDPITQNYYDAVALAASSYDAITIGNHEFDFGPDVLADFIGGYRAAGGSAPFISSNLDFSGEAALNALVNSGAIASSTIVTGAASGEQYAVIGVTTPAINNISSPGAVVPNGLTLQDVANAVNAEVAALPSGVNKVILSGHLQGLGEDQGLVPLLSGVDVIIAGGGDELLRNGPDANTSASFGPAIDGPYPTTSIAQDKDGKNIALVTTQGEYRYVGELEVEFDTSGNVTGIGGGDPNPILIDPSVSRQFSGIVNGIDVQADIMSPLAADMAALTATVIGATTVELDGRRASVRTMETNLGSLITDAFIWQAEQIGGLSGDPVISATNGGGIRNDAVIQPGDLTAGDIVGILPFPNAVVVLNDLSVDLLVGALENAVGRYPGQNGGFLQIGGFAFSFDQDTGEIREIRLDDGTLLYTHDLGDVFGGTLDLVTNSFTGAGGDGFDEFAMLTSIDLGVNYGDALRQFIATELNGMVDANAYPSGGLGRIVAVSVPVPVAGSLPLLLLGVSMFAAARRFRSTAV